MGEWIEHNSEKLNIYYIECSKCHVCIFIHMPWKNYCPNCGAKMKNEEEQIEKHEEIRTP